MKNQGDAMSRIAEVARLKKLEAEATHADVFFQDEQETGEMIQISPGCYEGGPEGMEKTGEVLIVSDKNAADVYPEEHAQFEHTADADLYVELRNAAPWLLAVVGQFHAGDADRLLFAVDYLKQTNCPAQCIDAVSRMLAAAETMEVGQDEI